MKSTKNRKREDTNNEHILQVEHGRFTLMIMPDSVRWSHSVFAGKNLHTSLSKDTQVSMHQICLLEEHRVEDVQV